MQGQRSAVGSLPETLGYSHGSSSSDAGIDQQICWNNMRNSAQNPMSEYVIPSDETNVPYLNPPSLERQNLGGWNAGETSSSTAQSPFGQEQSKMENMWSSSMSSCSGASLRLEERRYETPNILSMSSVEVDLSNNPIGSRNSFRQTSGSDIIRPDLNMNSGFEGHDADDCQVVECPVFKSVGSANDQMPSSTISSDPFGGMPSGTNGYLMEENDGHSGCTMDGRRLSCKRKAIEGHAGQSSGSGSSNYFQHAENSAWRAIPSNSGHPNSIPDPENSSNINLPEVTPRLGLSVGGTTSEAPLSLPASGNADGSRRNFRLRINASHHQDSVPRNVYPIESNIRNVSVSTADHSSRLLRNHSLDIRSVPAADNSSFQGQSMVVNVPPLRRSSHTRWHGSSSSRPGTSSGYALSGERDAVLNQESNSRNVLRNISQHPMFIPASEMGNSSQNSANWSLAGGNVSIGGNVASTSRSGSSSGPPHPWASQRNHPQYPRRLSELVRRSLLSAAGTDSGGQSSNSSHVHLGPSSVSEDNSIPSGSSSQGHPTSNSRSAVLVERHPDGGFGIPYSFRTLATASEGRSRLVSEIRNVLDLMRRGEGLRFEDVMILDQSILFGMADIHDRHRDMRLDVDNMSYEELLALEERIGNVCTGLTEENILGRLKQRKYVCIRKDDEMETEPCCVCQEEYNEGEDLGTLDCGHDFHTNCIKQWLMQKNLCPICKTTGLAT